MYFFSYVLKKGKKPKKEKKIRKVEKIYASNHRDSFLKANLPKFTILFKIYLKYAILQVVIICLNNH